MFRRKQQMIEIAKALMTNAEVIIMDEPTAALTEREISKLFDVMTALKRDGVSIVYISHRMEEIFSICDRITIMRDSLSIRRILKILILMKWSKMVGRELTDRYPTRTPSLGDKVLEVKNASKRKLFTDQFPCKRRRNPRRFRLNGCRTDRNHEGAVRN